MRAAVDAGLAGCSVEDWSGTEIYDAALATERIAAAVEAAAGELVITARAENYLHDRVDLADTIARLQSFAAAGADVVYAPGRGRGGRTRARSSPRSTARSTCWRCPSAPSVAELADLGVARVSVGGAFAFAALGALAEAGRELLDAGHVRLLGAGGRRSRDRRNAFGE